MNKISILMVIVFGFTLAGCGDAGDAVEAYKKLKESEKKIQELSAKLENTTNELDKYKSATKTMYD